MSYLHAEVLPVLTMFLYFITERLLTGPCLQCQIFMDVFIASFLIPLMSNEIENFPFSASRLSFILRCKEKDQSTPFSGNGMKRYRQKEPRAFIPEGGPVLCGWHMHFSTAVDYLTTLRGDVGKLLLKSLCTFETHEQLTLMNN